MMAAAAYLHINNVIAKPELILPDNDPEFPLWVAIDKHTNLGKIIYDEIAQNTGVDYYKLTQIGFYLEGSNVNALAPSPLWDAHKRYEMLRMGFTLQQAQEKWETEIKPLVVQKNQDEVIDLKNKIEDSQKEEDSTQFEFLFSK